MEFIGIIIAVAAFLFSSLFDNSKKQAPKPKSPQIPKPVKTERNRESTVLRVPEKAKKAVEKAVEKENPLSELERLHRENASLQKKIKMMEKQRSRGVQSPLPKKEDSADAEGLFTKDNVIQAVVFSEVLSAPRARNPHRASMHRKGKNRV
ncbi:hypothetical protein ACTQ5K_04955 [Niallia sp. Sow4_A1]|uniref:hypothetical protein n=1 Tax=Niallia sp. Sow4_A1 TaxID=3438793 RepID=UPI003F996851